MLVGLVSFTRDGRTMTESAYHLLREADAAALLGLEVATLRRWRWAGKGPVFRKIGAAVRYERADLDDFIAAARRGSTSNPGQAQFNGREVTAT
jgi:hypothetical protein